MKLSTKLSSLALVVGGVFVAQDVTDDFKLARGAVFPELTAAQRNAIVSPDTDLIINVDGTLERWDGANWQPLTGAASDSLYTADGTLAGNRVVSGGNNSLTLNGLNNFDVLAGLGYITIESGNDIALNAQTGSVNVRAGDLVVRGQGATAQGSIFIADDNDSNQVRIQVPDDVTSNWVLTLPPTPPSALGNILVDTNGAGALGWQAVTDGSIYAANGTLIGNRVLDSDGRTLALTGSGVKTFANTEPGVNNALTLGSTAVSLLADDLLGADQAQLQMTSEGAMVMSGTGVMRLESTQSYTLGDGSGGNTPALDTDAGDFLMSIDANGQLGRMNSTIAVEQFGTTNPVDGTTIAWFVNQFYTNTTTSARFYASTKSTDPDTSGAGSVWVPLPGTDVSTKFAEYHNTFTNFQNVGGFDTFVPTISGDYLIRYALGFTDNNVYAVIGTTAGAVDVFDGESTRLFGTAAGRETYQARVALTAGTTYHISAFAGGGTSTSEMIVDIYPDETLVLVRPEDVLVEDQSASGYFDTGTKREQWGRGTTNGAGQATISFPQPFANTNYALVLTAANGVHVEMTYNFDTTTGFQALALNLAGNGTPTSFSWYAIGVKP